MHSLHLSAAALAVAALSFPAAAQFNATQLSRFDPSGVSYNDVWGYVAPDGREFAILGATTGTYILDCSDPTSPRQTGFISGRNSTWRDMRTFGQYVYVVTEGGGGVQVIDMSDPDSPVLANTFGQSSVGAAHNVALDTGTGLLYPCGSNSGVPIFDLNVDPLNPPQIGSYTSAYVHDLAVEHGYGHLGEINNSRYRIIDVSNPASVQILGSASVSSCHNAWPSRDGQVAVATSERSNGGLTVFDISDKRLVQQRAFMRTGGSGTSVHNAYFRDRVVHASYYSEGYYAMDVTDAGTPVKVASFDTSSSTRGFSGAWGCYPFQPSGVVYISDTSNGLYVFGTPATTDLYGDGTAGAGTPTVHSFGAPYAGNANFAFEIEDATPGTAVSLFVCAAADDLTFSGLRVLVDLGGPFVMLSATADANGKAVFSVPLAQTLNATTIFVQAVTADASGPMGLSATKGMQVDIFKLGNL